MVWSSKPMKLTEITIKHKGLGLNIYGINRNNKKCLGVVDSYVSNNNTCLFML